MPNNESDYRSVSLPRELVNRVEALPLGDFGYASIAEFVKDAIRKKLQILAPAKAERKRRTRA